MIRFSSMLFAVLTLSACVRGSAPQPGDAEKSPLRNVAGIVTDGTDGGFIFETQNPDLKPETPITVIALEEPQKTGVGTLGEKLQGTEKSKTMIEEGTVPERYRLEIKEQVLAHGALGIGLVGDNYAPVKSHGLVGMDTDGDGTPEFFRDCTSKEGIHFGIRSGVPYKGKLIWHAYTYVGMDVEPTCSDDEFVIVVPDASKSSAAQPPQR